jgi:type IV secretion system protein VirB8
LIAIIGGIFFDFCVYMGKFGDTIHGFLSRFRGGAKNENSKSELSNESDRLNAVKNWYEERYETAITQRNILALVLLISLVGIIISIIAVMMISTSKSFDPFVIQIDEQTGLTEVVNPISSELISGDEAIAKYFIKKYVVARETYNPVDFDTLARKEVRLLSSPTVFWNFLGYIRNPDNDPVVKYGTNNTTYLKVRSWSKLKPKTYVLRFSINETSGAMLSENKISIIEIDYVPMELTSDERDINPIGFQVIGYKVDVDNS